MSYLVVLCNSENAIHPVYVYIREIAHEHHHIMAWINACGMQVWHHLECVHKDQLHEPSVLNNIGTTFIIYIQL